MQSSSSLLAKFCVGMITSPMQKAEFIAQALLKDKLVACVNIVPQVKSMYWWEDKICTDDEALLILKTQVDLKSQVVDCVKKNHEYEVPEVIFMDITDGNEDYLNWIKKSTTSSVEMKKGFDLISNQITSKSLEELTPPSTSMFKCDKCQGNKCTYYQMQTRSSDEPMTSFITCLNCGNRWKQ